MQEKKLSGTEITIAQGQAATKKIKAVYSHFEKSPQPKTGGITASNADTIITIGV